LISINRLPLKDEIYSYENFKLFTNPYQSKSTNFFQVNAALKFNRVIVLNQCWQDYLRIRDKSLINEQILYAGRRKEDGCGMFIYMNH
jgi:hypothetical protein